VRRGTRAFAALIGLATAGLLLSAASASATFHLIKVKEVFPGTVAQPESDYVELQSFSPFQNQVQFGQLQVYNADGSTAGTPFTPAGPLANNQDQRTVLIADSTFATVFAGITPDSTDTALNLSSAAGAVCWPVNSTPIDCASWGAFTGNANLPSSAGSPIQGSGASGAIGDGKAIIRSISAGCPTFLEDSDDTNNGAADFSEVTPAPRPNSAPLTEVSCAPPPGGVPPPVSSPTHKKKKCKKRKAATAPSGPSGPAYAAKKKCKKRK
jgi:hypothetical protein